MYLWFSCSAICISLILTLYSPDAFFFQAPAVIPCVVTVATQGFPCFHYLPWPELTGTCRGLAPLSLPSLFSLQCICIGFLRSFKNFLLWSALQHSLPALLWRWWRAVPFLGWFLDWFCTKPSQTPGKCSQSGAVYWRWVHTSKTHVIPPAGGRKRKTTLMKY